MSYHHISIRAGDALIDPLVINFENASASLGDRNYSLILTVMAKDNIAFTGFGSGFLARPCFNVSSTMEAKFGPQSGNTNELAVYDEAKTVDRRE